MTSMTPRHLVVAVAAAVVALAAGTITIAPAGCASDCGNDCPITSAIIATPQNVDPGILDLAWVGPACPTTRPSCRGDDRTTFCNRVDVPGVAEGYCDVLIQLDMRAPMAVRVEFGPPVTKGCCKGYPVKGDWYFTIPLAQDAGIYGGDGNTDAVRIIAPDAGPTTDASTATDADATDGGAD
jgi:hypothetical protein